MNIQWNKIKENIIGLTSPIFENGNPKISSDDIDELLNLLKKFIYFKSGEHFLDGLSKVLIPALQESFVSQKGDLGALRKLADSIEPFLRKIELVIKKTKYKDAVGMKLIPLLKHLKINDDLTSQKGENYPVLAKGNLDDFKNKKEFLHEICSAYLTRNEVHNSPNWNDLEVMSFARDIMVLLLFVTHQLKQEITDLPETYIVPPSDSEDIINTKENKMLYDFISFGKSTLEIKTEILTSFILHLLNKNDTCDIDTIIKESSAYFSHEFHYHFIQRILGKLHSKGIISYEKTEKNIIAALSQEERDRISKVQEDFQENKTNFYSLLNETLNTYGLEENFYPILNELKSFIECNYSADLHEVFDKGIDAADKESLNYESFLKHLKQATPSIEVAESLLGDLLQICMNNDFLLRISASKVLADIANIEQFQEYIKKTLKTVYLDTSIVLFALCTGYDERVKYDNPLFKITNELIDLGLKSPNINLKLTRHYVNEIAFQLKSALMLIPFEGFTKQKLSRNVFYRFYSYLKEEGILSEEDTLEKFMDEWLLLKEDDIYKKRFNNIVIENLKSILGEIEIEIVDLGRYLNVQSISELLSKTSWSQNLKDKPPAVLKNDALMICFLTDTNIHTTEPFFLTWDKSFAHYRKAYLAEYGRNEVIAWHLFTPAQFINHISLLEMKITSEAMTNEILSIISGFDIYEQTKTVWDTIGKFIDIRNIPPKQKRKYIKFIKDLLQNEFEYPLDNSEKDEDIPNEFINAFATILESIDVYFNNPTLTKSSIDDYRAALLDEQNFKKVSSLISSEIKYYLENNSYSNTITDNIDKLLIEHKEAKKNDV